MYERDQLFIDGKWAAPAVGVGHLGDIAAQRGGHRTRGLRGTRGCESGRRRGPGGFRHRAVASHATGRTDRGDHPAGRHLQGASGRHGRADICRDRRSHQVRQNGAGPASADHDVGILRFGGQLRVAADASGVVRQEHSDCEATGRRRGRGGAVEHAAIPHRHQSGAGAAGRLLGGAQARARVGARRPATRGNGRAGCRFRPAC